MISKLSRYAILGIAFFILWMLFAPVEWTPSTRIGLLLGTMEKSWIEARGDAQVAFAQNMAEAEAEVQRKTYAAQRATEVEADVDRRQVAAVSQTHFLQKLGANLADIGCGLGLIGEMVAPDDKDAADTGAADLRELCPVGDQLRSAMASDYEQALKAKRTDTMREMMDAFEGAHGTEDDR